MVTNEKIINDVINCGDRFPARARRDDAGSLLAVFHASPDESDHGRDAALFSGCRTLRTPDVHGTVCSRQRM